VQNFLSHIGVGKYKILYPFKIVWRKINPALFAYSHPNFAEVGGHKMFLDTKDTFHFSMGRIFEPIETEFVKREIKKGDTVLDIGANIGYYTLIFAKLVGENGKVFAFEPDPENFELLKKNVKINNYKNVVLIKKAVSNKSGKIKLYLSEDNKGGHRIYNSYDGRKSIEIESLKLDDYFKEFKGRINFIKIDIEGAEYAALEGMNSILRKNKKIKLMTEFLPSGLKDFGIDPERYLEFFVKHGFKLYNINEHRKKIEKSNITQLLEKSTLIKRNNYISLFCAK